ncbi:MAG: ABC transporter ATP-binding protein [Candidatus Cloacimonetes bacterium]|nr:ABC transporter ATP-binding protein [Candidatus Cloacimonadota bacterium]
MAYLQVENLRVVVDDFELNDINIDLEQGKILSLLGPSGAGKSTLIQAISGLIPINNGKISVKNIDITKLPVHKRKIGIVFQDFALFPHLNVYNNIAFGLRSQRLSKKTIQDKITYLLDLVGLSSYEKRDVNTLSGGEKQRVALARTLAPQPDIILFDEPLSAVDEELRTRLREQLAKVQQELGFTALYVTHDREEAFYFADLIGVIFEGRIWQIDRPGFVYEKPVNPVVARFLGIENRLTVEIIEEYKEGYMAKFVGHNIYIISKDDLQKGDLIDVLIKPERALISEQQEEENTFPVSLISSKNYGSKSELSVDLFGAPIKILLPDSKPLSLRTDQLFLKLKPENLLSYKNNVLLN